MNLTSPLIVSGGSTRSSKAYTGTGEIVPYTLGSRAATRDGRVFRFCQAASGAALIPGSVVQAAAQNTALQDLAVAVASVGATALTVTPGATTALSNQFAEGVFVVSTAPDLGSTYGIDGHAAIASATAFVLNLYDDDPIQTAFSTATRIDLVQNLYKFVVQAPITTLTSAPVGVAVHAVGASEYGWVQTWGPGAVLIDGTPAVANLVSSPGAAAGGAAINSTTLTIIGTMLATGVSGKCKAVHICIAP